MRRAVIAYIPVLHQGYKTFFEHNADNAELYILGDDMIAEFTHLRKEIRQLDPADVKAAVEKWDIFTAVHILDKAMLADIATSGRKVVLPQEDIMLQLQETYLPNAPVTFDSIFLRWDRHNTVQENPVNPNISVSKEQFDQEMIVLADEEATKSSDWWRQVGCVVLQNGDVIVTTHNSHTPSPHSPYAHGDPRNNFSKGVHLELGTSIHAEAAAIATAAKHGFCLKGATVYVSTFPCPPCAKLIAHSGIKKVYYRVGYGVLDAETILIDHGVEIVRVEM